MRVKWFIFGFILAWGGVCLISPGWGQSANGSISGTVLDPSGAVVPGVKLTLTSVEQQTKSIVLSGPDGLYSFQNLQTGRYEVKAVAKGFREFVQKGIILAINQNARVDVKLELGVEAQSVEVLANASSLNFENAVRQDGVSPDTLAELPLMVSGGVRSSANFAILMPGVATGGTANAYDARFNGGLQSGDEAIMDGISMQQGFMNQNGMVSIQTDFPLTPDMISEIKIVATNYEPQYGSTLSSAIVAATKSGTDQFHGGGYWYHRNTALNARPWHASERPKDLENDAGGYIGGPVRVRGLWGPQAKTYFYVNFEAFRIRGGVNTPTISIPSLKERQGDFSDWVDEQGNLIPIFDPATTRPNPAYDPNSEAGPDNLLYLRDQFMGCDGRSPNLICPSRIENSLAMAWFKYLPEPTNSNPTLNYIPPKPVPDINFGLSNFWLIKGDHYFRANDHFAVTIYYQGASPNIHTILPEPIAYEDFTAPQYSFVNRFNWDHTFSPTLLNHIAYGYLNRNEAFGAINSRYVDQFPKIPGVAAYTGPPAIRFWSDGFTGFGSNSGSNIGNRTTRPTHIVNELLTWVKGRHTLKFGGEYRNLGGNIHSGGNQMGTFGFGRNETGLLGLNSGNPIASFLLEAVDYAWVDFRTVSSHYPRQRAYIAHFGDTWKLTPKWSFNIGLRWDLFTPFWEKYDRLSFFDPYGSNPGAGGRPGRLAFAGNSWGAASYEKRYPELTDWKAFAPRLGLAYGLNDRTVVRAGYGIFFNSAFYSGWGGGMSLDGFNATPAFGSSLGGMEPAFYLRDGFPQDFQQPPFIDSSYQNGKSISYRSLEGNRRPYAQHWNLTIERQLIKDLFFSLAYVGTKGTRLPSGMAPINALDPKLLSMGYQLYDQFQPGDTSLHGVPLPYPGWAEQLQGCWMGGPTVAHALLPYPQFCSSLWSFTENAGNSIYHSFQTKVEKRFSGGLFFLGSYTFSKLLSSAADNIQIAAGGPTQGWISPFERWRNKSLASDDVPQVFSVTAMFDLPFGKGKRFFNSNRVADKVLGGWSVSSIFRASSGIPFNFHNWSTCVVPAQFWAGCIPTVLPGTNPWAQDKAHFDPNQPLFRKEAFEPESSFSFYLGQGPRVSNLRGFGYHNQDVALVKEIRFSDKLRWQIRAEAFNLWNWHIFNSSGAFGGNSFDTDISSPIFGKWNGAVTNPRNIQIGTRLEF